MRPRTVATAATAPAAPSRCPTTPLVAASGTPAGAFSEHAPQARELRRVVQRRAGAVRVDEVDGVRFETGVGEGQFDGERPPMALCRMRRRHVVGIAG